MNKLALWSKVKANRSCTSFKRKMGNHKDQIKLPFKLGVAQTAAFSLVLSKLNTKRAEVEHILLFFFFLSSWHSFSISDLRSILLFFPPDIRHFFCHFSTKQSHLIAPNKPIQFKRHEKSRLSCPLFIRPVRWLVLVYQTKKCSTKKRSDEL